MDAVVLLLVMVFGVSHGVETYCDGRLDGAQCYGALGGAVVFKLMENASEIHKYLWMHAGTVIFDGRRNKFKFAADTLERSDFTPNTGIYRLSNLEIKDSGDYTLFLYNSSGFRTAERSLHLSVQDPVSSVQLRPECLPLGNKRVFCSSGEGDSPEYSWTLDGRTLTDTELLPGNDEPNSISLKVHVLGQLVCTVKNRVSTESKGLELNTCGFIFFNCTSNGTEISGWVDKASDPCFNPTTASSTTVGTLAILAGVLSSLFLLAIVAAICIKRTKQNNKPKEEKEEQELTYAEVKIVQRPGRPVERRSEAEVEYGEVKFSNRPEPTEELEDDRVYARVRKGR